MSAQTQQAPAAVIAVTRPGARLAARLAGLLEATVVVPERFRDEIAGAAPATYADSALAEVRRRWTQHPALVLIMASGVAVRSIAPLLEHKSHDPAVVCVDEAGQWAIPLLGGHQAGANQLAHRIAELLGGRAAITTASDVQGQPALDLLGRPLGWRIAPSSALTHASACLVNGDAIALYADPALPQARAQAIALLADSPNVKLVDSLDALADPAWAAGLIVSHRHTAQIRQLLAKSVCYQPPVLVAGLGCRRGVPAAELRAALERTLTESGLALGSIAALASAELKADEPGLQELAAELGIPLQIVTREQLAALGPAGLSPSAAQEKFDLPGVAEPSAMLVASGPLLAPKRAFERCTVALAIQGSAVAADFAPQADEPALPAPAPASGSLYLIGIGPGNPQQLTFAARDALQAADVVTGYRVYIDHVRPLLGEHQELIVTPTMGDEVGRARQAIELAAAGRKVALISSGDIGIYAMAGPVFELLRQQDWQGTQPEVEVLPGVSAIQAAAARLGAPISHDFCTISLSDLLTPWPVIERRIWAAARGDFVIGFYNPRSRERHWQLARAVEILRQYRPASTPIATVRNVTRPDETYAIDTLAEFDPASVDMFTLVLVGNSQSFSVGGRMGTPRGYRTTPAETPHADEALPAPDLDGASATYPITLTHLRGAEALVLGGGQVAERKVRGLLSAGARVRVVSPELSDTLRELAESGRIGWEPRGYQESDLDARPRLVFAATNLRTVNASVAQAAAARGLLCNVADAPDEGSFHLPAVARHHGVALAVSTDGESPARARTLRDQLAIWLEQGGSSDHGER